MDEAFLAMQEYYGTKYYNRVTLSVPENVARKLADAVKAQRIGLDNEDALADGIVHRSYARAKKYREQDRARINGMVIALTYVLGKPNDMALAETFIANDPAWRAL
jgi:hypothetical protein